MKFLQQKLPPTAYDHLSMAAEMTADTCPNCWGHVEYEGRYCDSSIDHQRKALVAMRNKGWVMRYAETHLPGFRYLAAGAQRWRHRC